MKKVWKITKITGRFALAAIVALGGVLVLGRSYKMIEEIDNGIY